MIKLSKWAKEYGITYKTAWKWFNEGTLPVKSKQLSTGTILVYNDENVNDKEVKTVIYCRVSNHSRKEELEYQVKRCEDFCLNNGWQISKVYKEIASGMNDKRKQLWTMFDSNPTRIVIENKDRLTRFGFTYIENFLKKSGTEVVVIHLDKEDEKDLIKDLVSIIYSFCARLYGMRRAYNKTQKIKEFILNPTDEIEKLKP